MWIIFLFLAVVIFNFVVDLLLRKQSGKPMLSRETRGDIFAYALMIIAIIGAVLFSNRFPDIVETLAEQPFPDWLGFTLIGGFLLYFWFGATITAIIGEGRSDFPAQVVKEAMSEGQIGFLGALSILVVGAAFVRLDFSLWLSLTLVVPIWIMLFLLWAASN
ncbi:MAG TPA: hypothetical protein VF627_05760, partial [Abditibacterium sp.]